MRIFLLLLVFLRNSIVHNAMSAILSTMQYFCLSYGKQKFLTLWEIKINKFPT